LLLIFARMGFASPFNPRTEYARQTWGSALPVKTQVPPIAAEGPKRRSTRIVRAVPLVVTRPTTSEKALLEETATISINCHGCRYFSQFSVQKNARITVQIGAAKDNSTPQKLRARVAWIRKSQRLAGLFQVGIEFETPQDIWHIEDTPEDWKSFSPSVEEDPAAVLTDIERLLQFAHVGTYYQLLGVQADTPHAEVKRKFYQLARRFHPDHHMDHPEWTPRLLALMESLTAAYKTLLDEEAKKRYDSSLERADAFKLGKERPERERLAHECLEKAQECLAAKNFVGSILWLRRAIEAKPDSSKYRTMLGRSLAAVPEYRREAVEQFEKAIELDPFNLTAHLQYAHMLEQMKLPGRARALYIHALELDSDNREARERLKHLDGLGPRSVSRPSLLSRLTGRQ
jgi:hypothetical protein